MSESILLVIIVKKAMCLRVCMCGHVCVGVQLDPRAWLHAGIG